MYRIMLVNDEENALKAITRSLRNYQDWVIETYTTTHDALKRAKHCHFDIVISDFHLSHANDTEFLSKISELQPNAQSIVLTGSSPDEAILHEFNKVFADSFSQLRSDDHLLRTSKNLQTQSTFIPIHRDKKTPQK